MQQFALAVALLGAVFTQLQGCGGDTATTVAPVPTETTATPTTGGTDAPAAPTATVFEIGFKLDGMTKAQAESVKPALEKGIADGFGLAASAVTITSIEPATRRLEDRALASHSTSLDIKFTATVPMDQVTTVAAKAVAVAADSSTLLTAVKAAVDASDAPAEVKAAMAAATVSGFSVISQTVTDAAPGNTTRRLAFTFVTADEPLIL